MGNGCLPLGYSAYQFLSDYENQNVISIQRYSKEKGVFETAGFAPDGVAAGVDFDVAAGEGYMVFRKE